MWSEFKYTYLWAWKEDKGRFTRIILGMVAVLLMIGFLIYHTATAIPKPGTISQSPRLEVIK
jgi:flagellar biogenesis protein FliO